MANIAQVQTQLNALGYAAKVNPAWAPPSPGIPVDGKSSPLLVAMIRLFQMTHGLTVNGLLGASTLAKIAAAYAAKETSDAAVAAAQGQPPPPIVVESFYDNAGNKISQPGQHFDQSGNLMSTTAAVFDASGNATMNATLQDASDPEGGTDAAAAAQAAQVAALAAGSAPGGNPIGNVPGPIVPYRPPAAPIPWWVWAIGGVVVLGGGTAIAVGVSKK